MENTTQANTTPSNGSTIKELITILKDGEIKDSILSLKTFTGMDIVKDKETQTPVISLYGTKKEGTEDNQEEKSQGNQGNNEESNEGKENPVKPQSNNESNEALRYRFAQPFKGSNKETYACNEAICTL